MNYPNRWQTNTTLHPQSSRRAGSIISGRMAVTVKKRKNHVQGYRTRTCIFLPRSPNSAFAASPLLRVLIAASSTVLLSLSLSLLRRAESPFFGSRVLESKKKKAEMELPQNNVGILAMDIYFPPTCVHQATASLRFLTVFGFFLKELLLHVMDFVFLSVFDV